MKRTAMICASMISVATAQESRPLKVLLLHDMEGLSGEDDWRMTTITYPTQYAKGRQLLMDDVNAVIAGLFDGGATAVDVTDGHGSGNHEPDILLEQLDERAKMIFRDRPFDPYSDLVEQGAYDAVVNVGMHAKPGSRGFLSHTYTGGVEPRPGWPFLHHSGTCDAHVMLVGAPISGSLALADPSPGPDPLSACYTAAATNAIPSATSTPPTSCR